MAQRLDLYDPDPQDGEIAIPPGLPALPRHSPLDVPRHHHDTLTGRFKSPLTHGGGGGWAGVLAAVFERWVADALSTDPARSVPAIALLRRASAPPYPDCVEAAATITGRDPARIVAALMKRAGVAPEAAEGIGHHVA